MAILFHNVKAYLGPNRFAQAVLVRGNRIEAVGSNGEVAAVAAAKAGPDVEIIDCGGRLLLPGFNDSHMHLMEFGEGLRQAPVAEAGSVEDLIRICRTFALAHPEFVRRGMHAAGWNQDNFPDGRIPDRRDLDRISRDYPIVLERVCGHICVTNSRAIELLGLTGEGKLPADGQMGTHEDGEPNGIFYGNACLRVRKLIPEFTEEERLAILEEAMDYAARRGVSAVQSNDVGAMGGRQEDNLALFRRLYDRGRGRIRYRHQVNFDSLEEFQDCLHHGEYARAGNLYSADSLLSLGPLKLYKDGSLGARTALLSRSYPGTPGEHGLEWTGEEEMLDYCRLATEHNIQVVTHCIGDAATAGTADCYIRVNREILKTEGNPLRHGLVHCQLTDQVTLQKIREHDLLALVQPVFLHADIPILPGLIDPDLAASSYAFASLAGVRADREAGKAALESAGASCRTGGGRGPGTGASDMYGAAGMPPSYRLSLGTDCPVEDCDPFQNIYCAVTRKRLSGGGSFHPEERLTVSQAVDAYTAGSAYAMFMEDRLGRIRPGYLADLVLLDRDIFACADRPEEILKTSPLLTMVDGQVVYGG